MRGGRGGSHVFRMQLCWRPRGRTRPTSTSRSAPWSALRARTAWTAARLLPSFDWRRLPAQVRASAVGRGISDARSGLIERTVHAWGPATLSRERADDTVARRIVRSLYPREKVPEDVVVPVLAALGQSISLSTKVRFLGSQARTGARSLTRPAAPCAVLQPPPTGPRC